MDFSTVSGIEAFPPYLNPFHFNQWKQKVCEKRQWVFLEHLPESLPYGLDEWLQEWTQPDSIPVLSLNEFDQVSELFSLFSSHPCGVVLSNYSLEKVNLDPAVEIELLKICSLSAWATRWEHYNLCLMSEDENFHSFALENNLLALCFSHPKLIRDFYLKQQQNPFWTSSQFDKFLRDNKREYLEKHYSEFDLETLWRLEEANFQSDSSTDQSLLKDLKDHLILEETVHGYSLHPLFKRSLLQEPSDEPKFWMGLDQRFDFRLNNDQFQATNPVVQTYLNGETDAVDCWNSLLERSIETEGTVNTHEMVETLELLVELSQNPECPMPFSRLIDLKNLANSSPNPWWRHKFQLILMDYYLIHSSRLEIEKLILDRYSHFCELGHAQAMSEFLFREGLHHYLNNLQLLAIHLCFSAYEISKDPETKQHYHCYALLMSLCQPHCDWGVGLREMESNLHSLHQVEVCFLHAVQALGQYEVNEFVYWRNQLEQLNLGNSKMKGFLLPFLDALKTKTLNPFEKFHESLSGTEVLHGKQRLFWSRLLKDLSNDWQTLINLNGHCRLINSSTVRIERDRFQNYDVFFDFIESKFWVKDIGELKLVRSRILLLLFFVLALKPGHRLSFQRLFELVWGKDFNVDFDEQTVRTAVSRLKKQIEVDKDEKIGFGLTDGQPFLKESLRFCILMGPSELSELTPIAQKLISSDSDST